MHASSPFTQQASQFANHTDGQSATKLTVEVDPLAILTEQLSQMDTKQTEHDLKLTQLDAKLTVSVCILYHTWTSRSRTSPSDFAPALAVLLQQLIDIMQTMAATNKPT